MLTTLIHAILKELTIKDFNPSPLAIPYLMYDLLLTLAHDHWLEPTDVRLLLEQYLQYVSGCIEQRNCVEVRQFELATQLKDKHHLIELNKSFKQLDVILTKEKHHWPVPYQAMSENAFKELWQKQQALWKESGSVNDQQLLTQLERDHQYFILAEFLLASCHKARFMSLTAFEKAYAQLVQRLNSFLDQHLSLEAIALYHRLVQTCLTTRQAMQAASFSRTSLLQDILNVLQKINATPPLSLSFKGQWQVYGDTLAQIREHFPKAVNDFTEIAPITAKVGEAYQHFFAKLIEDGLSFLGPAPISFALAAYGSYARKQLLLFSDVEFVLLLEKDLPDNHPYFEALLKLVAFKVQSLGESHPKELGFHLDTGVLPHQDRRFWGTPDILATRVLEGKTFPKESEEDTKAISLLHLELFYGDETLVYQFKNHIAHLNSSSNLTTAPALTSIQSLSLNCLQRNVRLWQERCQSTEPTIFISLLEVKKGVVEIKHDYAAWLQYFITGLGLYHAIQATQLSDILQALVEQNKLERHFAAYSEALLNAITALRFKVQRHYQGAVDFARWPALADPSLPSPKLGKDWYDLNETEYRLLMTFEHSVLRPLCTTLERAFQSDQELNQRLDPWGELQQALQIQEAVETQPVFQSFLNWLNLSNANKLLEVDLTQCACAIQCFLDSFLYLESSALFSPFDGVAAKQHRAFYLELSPSLRPLYLYYLEQRLKEYPDHPILQKLTTLPEPNGDRAITWKRQRAWIALLQKVLIPIATTKADELRQQGKLVVTAYDLQQTSYTKLQHYQVPPELEPYILNPETQNWKKKEATQPGRHTVFEMVVGEDKLWWKLCPEQPGTERLVYSLSERLCGGGTPPNLVVKCELKGQVYGVQLSQHVPGDALQAVLHKQPERLQRLPLSQFIAALLRVLQTNPEDDKPDDYRIKITSHQTEMLGRLDNERAFYTPEDSQSSLLLTAKKFLQVKSVILCFDQMVMPWSKEEIEDYLLLNPALIIESEIREAKHYHAYFKMLFKIGTDQTDQAKIIKAHYQTIIYQNPDLPGPSVLTVAMAQGWVKEQWNRLTSLQTVIKNALKQNTPVTGLLLLETVQPVLAAHYKKAFQAYPVASSDPNQVSKRFELVTQGLYKTVQGYHQLRMPTVEAVTKSLRLKVHLNVQEVIRIYRGEILSPFQAEEELNAIKATHKEQLLAALLAGESGSQAVFHSLTSPHQTSLIEKVIADLHQHPKAYSHKAQQNLLKAMANLCFHHLSLSVFREVLTDGLLIPFLKSSGASLLSLDVSHCLKITVVSLNVWLSDCPNLQTLNLQHCPQLTYAGLVPDSEALLSLTELKLTGSGLAQSSRIIALLEAYPFLLGLVNWDEFTETAQAALLEAMKEAALSKEAGAREAKYHIRSFFKQWLAYREQVISILISSLSKTQPTFLGGEEPEVRRDCAEALGDLQQSPLRIVKAMLVALKDSDEWVRRNAVHFLDQIGGGHADLVVPALPKALENSDRWVRRSAVQSLGQIGGNHADFVVPALLKALEDRDDGVRSDAAQSLGQIGRNHADFVVPALLKALADRNDRVRSRAVQSLGQIGRNHADFVVPALLKVLADRNDGVRSRAAQSLGQIGRNHADFVVPALLKVLADKNDGVRSRAVQSLGQIGGNYADFVVSALLKALENSDEWVRRSAARSLGQIGGRHVDLVVSALLKALEDRDYKVRSDAAHFLGQIGGRHVDLVVPVLLKALEDSDGGVRSVAAQSLSQIGGNHADLIVPALLKALEDSDDKVRSDAAQSLGQIGGRNVDLVVPALLKAFEDSDGSVRRSAAQSLGQIGGRHADLVVPALLKALKKDSWVHSDVGQSLGQIGGNHADLVVPALLKALEDRDYEIRSYAAQFLGQIRGNHPNLVVPALLKALEDRNDRVRSHATQSLGQIGENHADLVVPALLKALEDKEEKDWVRSRAAQSLGQIGGNHADLAVPALLKALEDGNYEVRSHAAQSLGQIGGCHADLVFLALLKKMLKDSDDGVRSRAAQSLGQIGGCHADLVVLALLKKILNKDSDDGVRSRAAQSLGQIGGNYADLVVLALLKALEDRDDGVRSHAAQSLDKIGVGYSDLVVSTLLARLKNHDFNAAEVLSQWLSPTHPSLKYQLKKIMAPYGNTSKTRPHAPVSPTEKPPASTAASTYSLHTTPTLFFNPPPASSHLTTNDNNNNNNTAQTLSSVAEASDVQQQALIHSLNHMHHS